MSETPLEGLSREELEQRLAHAMAVGDEDAIADADTSLSARLLAAGDAAAARRHAERAVAVRRQHDTRDNDRDLARALEALGHAAQALGDGEAATGAYLEAIDLASRSRHRAMVASLLSSLGGMAASSGDRARARDLLGAALRSAPQPRADAARRAEIGLARLELEDGDDSSAARRALRVLQGGAGGELALLCARVLHDAGLAARSRNDQQIARQRYEFALPVLRRDGTPDALVELLGLLGAACRHSDDPAAARTYWHEALTLCDDAEDGAALDARSVLLHDLGDMCLADLDDAAAAVPYLEGALAAADSAGRLDGWAGAAGLLHRAAARMIGDRATAERWRTVHARAAFAAAAAVVADDLVARRIEVASLPTYVLGDSGGRPETVRLPGGRVGEGLLWRRRLAAELRHAAPSGRVAVLRPVRRPAGTVDESLQLVVLDRGGAEARVALVERSGSSVACGRWLRVAPPAVGDRLVEALWAALR